MRERVKARMKELGINPNQLAKRMGQKGNGTIWSFLSGRTGSFRDMPKLAEALDTSSEWLLTGEEPKQFPARHTNPLPVDDDFRRILKITFEVWEQMKHPTTPAIALEIAIEIYEKDKNEKPKIVRSNIERLMAYEAKRMR